MWELTDTKLLRRLVALFMLLVTLVGIWQGLLLGSRVTNWVTAKIAPLQEARSLGQINWTHYRNATYGFQLQYPPDWQLQETKATAKTPFTLALAPAPDQVSSSSTGHSSPTRLVLSISKKRLLTQLTLQESDRRPILLNGHSGVIITQAPISSTHVAGEASPLSAHTIYIKTQSYNFIFLMRTQVSDRHSDDLQAIISGFQFTAK